MIGNVPLTVQNKIFRQAFFRRFSSPFERGRRDPCELRLQKASHTALVVASTLARLRHGDGVFAAWAPRQSPTRLS